MANDKSQSAGEGKPQSNRMVVSVAVVLALGILAFTTWDSIRQSDQSIKTRHSLEFRKAAFAGDVVTVKRMLQDHPDFINSVGGPESTNISKAKKPPTRLTPAQERTTTFESGDSTGATALHHAAFTTNRMIAELLLAAGADPNRTNSYGRSPVFLAVHTGDTILVDALIKAGARLNMTNEFHSNPLTAVCGSPRCTREMVDLLIERGADPKLRVGPRQTTALHSAAVQGNPEIIHHLIEAGVDVNAKTTDGFTALHFAHEQNKTAAIELLKNSGATE